MSNFEIAKTFELILGLEKKYLKVEKLEMVKIRIFGIRRNFFSFHVALFFFFRSKRNLFRNLDPVFWNGKSHKSSEKSTQGSEKLPLDSDFKDFKPFDID